MKCKICNKEKECLCRNEWTLRDEKAFKLGEKSKREETAREIFDILDIFINRIDDRLISVIATHGIKLDDITPNYKDIKNKFIQNKKVER